MDLARIGIARLRAADPGMRGAVDRLAGVLDFRVPGLGPEAILVMRSLQLRSRMRLEAVANDARGAAVLGRALQETLGRARRSASRISGSSPGPETGAVYFADMAELMACLARDWLEGRAASRWWWRVLLRDRPAERVVVDHCLRHPESMPSMLGQLASTSHALRFALSIREADARVLARAMVEAFAVEHDVDELIAEQGGASPGPPTPASTQARRIEAALPECRHDSLPPLATLLLALGLGLHRIPAGVRSPAFPEFARRTAASRARVRDLQREPLLRPMPLQEAAAPSPDPPRAFERSRLPSREPDLLVRGPSTMPIAKAIGSVPQARAHAQPARQPAGTTREGSAAPVTDASPAAREAPSRVRAVPFVAPTLAGGRAEIACETRFGGIFYVLNAALHMGLYGDFTQPRRRGLAASPWDFLAVCGRDRFGKRFVADPAWRLLAGLAGRAPEDEPGQDLDPECVRRVMERIALALGERRPRRAIAKLVLADASVIDTGTRVDVHLALARLPLCVRYAGLDRDPGWIPAAGRRVAFHFA